MILVQQVRLVVEEGKPAIPTLEGIPGPIVDDRYEPMRRSDGAEWRDGSV
jgi:hypothetical protein